MSEAEARELTHGIEPTVLTEEPVIDGTAIHSRELVLEYASDPVIRETRHYPFAADHPSWRLHSSTFEEGGSHGS